MTSESRYTSVPPGGEGQSFACGVGRRAPFAGAIEHHIEQDTHNFLSVIDIASLKPDFGFHDPVLWLDGESLGRLVGRKLEFDELGFKVLRLRAGASFWLAFCHLASLLEAQLMLMWALMGVTGGCQKTSIGQKQ